VNCRPTAFGSVRFSETNFGYSLVYTVSDDETRSRYARRQNLNRVTLRLGNLWFSMAAFEGRATHPFVTGSTERKPIMVVAKFLIATLTWYSIYL